MSVYSCCLHSHTLSCRTLTVLLLALWIFVWFWILEETVLFLCRILGQSYRVEVQVCAQRGKKLSINTVICVSFGMFQDFLWPPCRWESPIEMMFWNWDCSSSPSKDNLKRWLTNLIFKKKGKEPVDMLKSALCIDECPRIKDNVLLTMNWVTKYRSLFHGALSCC